MGTEIRHEPLIIICTACASVFVCEQSSTSCALNMDKCCSHSVQNGSQKCCFCSTQLPLRSCLRSHKRGTRNVVTARSYFCCLHVFLLHLLHRLHEIGKMHSFVTRTLRV